MSKKKKIKKLIAKVYLTIGLISVPTSIFAQGGGNFISDAIPSLQMLVTLIGVGLGLWGLVNLIEGYGGDNPGAKSQGMKQFMSGAGLVAIAQALIPLIANYVNM